MSEPVSPSYRKFSWVPGVAAMLAFIACNGTFIVVGLLSLLGVSQAINPHIQAAVVSLFAMATLIFVYLVFKHSARQGHWYWR